MTPAAGDGTCIDVWKKQNKKKQLLNLLHSPCYKQYKWLKEDVCVHTLSVSISQTTSSSATVSPTATA